MKRIVLFSEESIFSGNVKCGIAEVVDSLALTLVKNYEVYVVCQEGTSVPSRRFVDFEEVDEDTSYALTMKIHYYVLKEKNWSSRSVEIVNSIRPDIVHNFCEPALISKLKARPSVSIFTFDDIEFLEDKLDYLDDYDFITTFSSGYRDYVLSLSGPVADKLRFLNFPKVKCGIAAEIFNPSAGLFLKTPYSSANIEDKEPNKKQLLNFIKCEKNKPIFLTMGNISQKKGADLILQAIPLIEKKGGKMVIFGSAPSPYRQSLEQLARSGVLFYHKKVKPSSIPPMLAGADFYLQPSLMESGGLMPLAASRYGAVPIVTPNGGFQDNFNGNNAIIVEDDIFLAINEAFQLYSDRPEFTKKQKVCMEQDFSWNTRIADYLVLYESKGEKQ